jgi:hypothetical protein
MGILMTTCPEFLGISGRGSVGEENAYLNEKTTHL